MSAIFCSSPSLPAAPSVAASLGSNGLDARVQETVGAGFFNHDLAFFIQVYLRGRVLDESNNVRWSAISDSMKQFGMNFESTLWANFFHTKTKMLLQGLCSEHPAKKALSPSEATLLRVVYDDSYQLMDSSHRINWEGCFSLLSSYNISAELDPILLEGAKGVGALFDAKIAMLWNSVLPAPDYPGWIVAHWGVGGGDYFGVQESFFFEQVISRYKAHDPATGTLRGWMDERAVIDWTAFALKMQEFGILQSPEFFAMCYIRKTQYLWESTQYSRSFWDRLNLPSTTPAETLLQIPVSQGLQPAANANRSRLNSLISALVPTERSSPSGSASSEAESGIETHPAEGLMGLLINPNFTTTPNNFLERGPTSLEANNRDRGRPVSFNENMGVPLQDSEEESNAAPSSDIGLSLGMDY